MTDPAFYERALRRVYRVMLTLVILGAVVAAWIGGWRGGMGFVAGAAASALSFHWLKQFAEGLRSGMKRRVLTLAALRYLLFGAAGYAIVKYLEVSLTALVVGLFVSVAAVVGEIVYELIYARA